MKEENKVYLFGAYRALHKDGKTGFGNNNIEQ